ncbi:MAG: xanthine dehydrogenase family protein molybdopterin-binding subunit [Gemmatimonadota bacterium]
MPGRRFTSTKVEIEGREEIKILELPDLEPTPWGADAALTIVGQRVPRADALEKVTGRAIYTADTQRAGMLHAALVRAPVASGRVTLLDLSRALALPGVRGSLVLSDVPGISHMGAPLFDVVIHWAGQPLAAICADTFDIARQACALVALEVEAAAHAVTLGQALAPDAPVVRPGGNIPEGQPRISARGDADGARASADVVITREYRTPCALHSPLEPHAAVAEWNGDHLTVWESTQGIFQVRKDVARAFRLPLNRVRVMKDYMGGGFGAKNYAAAHTYTAVALAKQLGRPVRCVLDREGEQTDTGNRAATQQRVTLAARHDGTLVSISADVTVAYGYSGWFASPAKIFHEMYQCDNVRTSETFVHLNTGAMDSFRAPGHVEGAFALECAMDALARELGIDPLELRRRNYAPRDQDKNREYSAKHLDRCYEEGAARFAWTHRRVEAAATRVHGARLRRGVGMASQIWVAGGGPPAYATVRLNPDGTVDVLTGAQDLGTGSRTIFAQIAAEVLGARLADVRTVLGDTERTPYAGNSWGSITTASVGPAVRVAALHVRERVLEAAAELLGVSADRLDLRGSVVTMAGDDRTMTLAQIGRKLGDVMIIGQGSRGANPKDTAICAFAAQFAEVEVDVETGRVRVLHITSAHDSGRIINPTLAESQLEGGIIQGLGLALFEERVLDASLGLSMTPNLHDYKIPTMADIPTIDAFFVESSDVIANHTGARGIAEAPIIPTAPAIANAVADALGVEVTEIPLTPWRLRQALRGQGTGDR